MKFSVVGFLIVLFPCFVFAKITSMPSQIAGFCGLQFVENNADPNRIYIEPEPSEGNTEIDATQFEFSLAKLTSTAAVYQIKNIKLFERGAPSYWFDLTFTLPLNKFKPGDASFGAAIEGTTLGFTVYGPNKKVINQGISPEQSTFVALNQENEVTQMHYNSADNYNPYFRTSTRIGVFNCSFQH